MARLLRAADALPRALARRPLPAARHCAGLAAAQRSEPAVAGADPAALVTGAGTSPAAFGGGERSLQAAEAAGLPALRRTDAYGIEYRGPIEGDMEGGGGRHASTIGQMWSNVPLHVRQSFTPPAQLEATQSAMVPSMIDNVFDQAKALIARTGLAPESWNNTASAQYYNGEIALEPYQRGQTAAYNYPRQLVPRSRALRVPLDMYVDPVYYTTDNVHKARAKPRTLFPVVQGKVTLLLVFSAQPLSSLSTGVKQWLDEVGPEFLKLRNAQVLKVHAEEGWINRQTHQVTRFHLRQQMDEEEQFRTFVYRGKWKWEYVRNLHLYNRDLPGILLVDPHGYVRWHAVGLPTKDATEVLRSQARRLTFEKDTL